MKILLSYDGSECSDRAAEFVLGTLREQMPSMELDVIYVDAPMPDRVAATLGAATVARLQRENADLVLGRLRTRCEHARMPYTETLAIGPVAAKITEHAEKEKSELVIMGSYGRSATGNRYLGSVTRRVLVECGVPVLIVR